MVLLVIQFPGHNILQSTGPRDFLLTQPASNLIQTGLLSEWEGASTPSSVSAGLGLVFCFGFGRQEGGRACCGLVAILSDLVLAKEDSGFQNLGGFALDLEQVGRLQDPATNFCRSLPTHF